jgi:hypothetical protein
MWNNDFRAPYAAPRAGAGAYINEASGRGKANEDEDDFGGTDVSSLLV